MTKLTNRTKNMQIVKLEDGTAIFMKSGQITETDKKIKEAPDGVRVDTSHKKKNTKIKQEQDEDQILEENS